LKAIIMAGGEGKRLRPITERIPKPLVEVGGIPIIEHIFKLLIKHNISEAWITTRYLGNLIEERFGDSYFLDGDNSAKLCLRYSAEDTPLGTAGGVKKAFDSAGFDSSFLVISGDAMTDIDLSAAEAFHTQNSADVTIILSSASDPREYGTVLCGSDGRITRFIEKPAWQQVLTDTVNTGIYIINQEVMSYIPKGVSFDFSNDLFPVLLRGGKRLMGFETDSHWCDIGSIPDYYRENMYYSDGENVFSKTGISAISDGASISGSILYSGVKIGEGSSINNSVICENTVAGMNVTVGAGSIIGAQCSLGDGSFILPGTRLPSGTVIEKNKIVGRGVKQNISFVFDEGGLIGTGEICSFAELGKSIGSASGTGARIGVISGRSSREHLLKETLMCGIAAVGCTAFDFGDGSSSMAAFAGARLGMTLMVHIKDIKESTVSGCQDNEKIKVSFFDEDGLYPSRAFERALFASLEDKVQESSLVSDIERCDDLSLLYRSALISSARDELRLTGEKHIQKTSVHVAGSEDTDMLGIVLAELGFDVTDENDCDLIVEYEGQQELYITDNRNGKTEKTDMWHVTAILALNGIKHGSLPDAALPYIAPLCIEKILADGNVTIAKYRDCPSDREDEAARKNSGKTPWICDAAFAAVRICAVLGSGVHLKSLSEEIPDFYYSDTHIPADCTGKIRIMRTLGKPEAEGVIIKGEKGGCVRIIPDCGDSVRVITDAESTEAAEELLSFSEQKIREIIKNK